jgi:hypothetical protein
MAIPKKTQKTFFAVMHVTRVEHWRVDAETEEQAREMLLAGTSRICFLP